MDSGTAIVLITAIALIGIAATVAILASRDRASKDEAESPFAASSEGMTACRLCGRANLVTDDACLYCGTPLPRHRDAS